MLPIHLLSTGKALPEQHQQSRPLNWMPAWAIGQATYARNPVSTFATMPRWGEHQSELAGAAVRDALRRADVPAASIDLLISASGVQEQALPNTAAHILEPAGLPAGTPAFDVNASCLSFLTALHVASSLLTTGAYKRIAVVASDLAHAASTGTMPRPR